MKNKKKSIIASGLFALALAATSVGTTFALFTDRADTKIDVKAGIVDVSASIIDFTTYSAEANETDGDRIDENGRKYISKVTEVAGVFTNSGTAEVSSTTTSSVVDLKRITPGDRVTFNVELGNASNVDIKYRVFYRVVGEDLDLAKAMSTTLTLGNNKETHVGLYKYESPWTLLKPTDTLPNVAFDIELPINKGNEYQDKSAQYMLGIEAVQGNASLTDGKTVSTIYEDARETSVATDADVVVDATNRDHTVRVVTTIPAAAKEVTSGQTVELVVSDLIVENTDQEDVGKLVFDASLFVNGQKTTSFSEDVKVQVYLGKDLEITELTHNNEKITNFTYDRMEGLIEFYTQSFSPFGVGFKKLAKKSIFLDKNDQDGGTVSLYAKTGVKDTNGDDLYKVVSDSKAFVNEVARFVASPNHGYVFKGWQVGDDETIIPTNPYEILVDEEFSKIKAVFAYDEYDLSFTSENEEKGTVASSSTTGKYHFKDEVTLTATANEGYSFEGWYDADGNKVSDVNPYQFVVNGEDNNYHAKFSTNSYSVTINNPNSDLGTVSGEGVYEYKSEVSLSATPNPGVHFDGWYDGETCVSTELNYKFTVPASDKVIKAKFSYIPYSVTVACDTEKGTISGEGESYHYGDNVTLIVTEKPGYTFVGWYDQNDNLITSEKTYTVESLTENVSLNTKFSTNSYTFNLTGDNEFGSAQILTSGVTSGSSVLYNSEIKVKATVNDGGAFNGWYVGETKVGSEVEFTYKMGANDTTLRADFIEDPEYSMFNFELNSDEETYSVIGLKKGKYTSGMDLIFPSTYKGKKITRVTVPISNPEGGWPSPIYDSNNIKLYDTMYGLNFGTVKCNSNITEIGPYTFAGGSEDDRHTKINKFEGFENLKSLGPVAFYGTEFGEKANIHFTNLIDVDGAVFEHAANIRSLTFDKLTYDGIFKYKSTIFYGIKNDGFESLTFNKGCEFNGNPLGYSQSFTGLSVKKIYFKCTNFKIPDNFCWCWPKSRPGTDQLTDIYVYNNVVVLGNKDGNNIDEYILKDQNTAKLHYGVGCQLPNGFLGRFGNRAFQEDLVID